MSANSTPSKTIKPVDGTVKFLIACIKTSGNGRPDFAKVAETLGIVSKGAAAKRYERLLKAHNEFGTSTDDGDATDNSPTKAGRQSEKRKVTADSSAQDESKPNKKRLIKKEKPKDAEDGHDDEDTLIKPEPAPWE